MKKQDSTISGQLTLADFCSDIGNYVVQTSELIFTEQKLLSARAFKLIRLAIMQIKPGDQDFKAYYIPIKEVAELLNVDVENLYRRAYPNEKDNKTQVIEVITNEIMDSYVTIRDEAGNFAKIHWGNCYYIKGKGVFIKLDKDLKPYLLGIQNIYGNTKYGFFEIKDMKSCYTGRVYEYIIGRIATSPETSLNHHVIVSVEELRKLTETEVTLKQFVQFRTKVLDVITREINEYTSSRIKYSTIKTGKTITHIDFYIENIA